MNLNFMLYGSHTPLVKSLLQVYNISGVIELGIGNYSTKTFFDSDVQNICSIETDESWIKNISKKYSDSGRLEYIFHDCGNIDSMESRKNIDSSQHKKNCNFYKTLNTEGYNFLFIDHLISLRRESLDILYKNFDMIVLHDINMAINKKNSEKVFPISNPENILIDKRYQESLKRSSYYTFLCHEDEDLGLFKLDNKYSLIIDKSLHVHTGVFLKRGLLEKYEQLKSVHSIMLENFLIECMMNPRDFNSRLEKFL